MSDGFSSFGGAIVPRTLDEYTPADYIRSFRNLAEDIAEGRVTINRLEVLKAGKGGPDWVITINLTDTGERG